MPRYIRAGKYNEIHESDLPVIVGAGTSASNRKDIMTMDWDGNVELAGGITSGGDLSVDGDADIDGDTSLGGDLSVHGDLKLLSGDSDIQIKKLISDVSYTTNISGLGISTTDISAKEIRLEGQELFVPWMNVFRLFFDYPTYNKEIYFSLPAKQQFPSDATSNEDIIRCLQSFLWIAWPSDYRSDEHLNTSLLILQNQDKIFPVHGTINNCKVLGMYVYTGSDTPRYQIDIICIDSSETSGYKVYTWVNDPNATPSAGETYITLQNHFITAYSLEYAYF